MLKVINIPVEWLYNIMQNFLAFKVWHISSTKFVKILYKKSKSIVWKRNWFTAGYTISIHDVITKTKRTGKEQVYNIWKILIVNTTLFLFDFDLSRHYVPFDVNSHFMLLQFHVISNRCFFLFNFCVLVDVFHVDPFYPCRRFFRFDVTSPSALIISTFVLQILSCWRFLLQRFVGESGKQSQKGAWGVLFGISQ